MDSEKDKRSKELSLLLDLYDEAERKGKTEIKTEIAIKIADLISGWRKREN